MSTFGVSTVNSTKSLLNTPSYNTNEHIHLQQKHEGLVQENRRYISILPVHFLFTNLKFFM